MKTFLLLHLNAAEFGIFCNEIAHSVPFWIFNFSEVSIKKTNKQGIVSTGLAFGALNFWMVHLERRIIFFHLRVADEKRISELKASNESEYFAICCVEKV